MSAFAHLRFLCEEIGPRPRGSEANHQAAAYIARAFASQGLESRGFESQGLDSRVLSVEEQKIELPVWQHEATRLELYGQPLAAEANPFTLPCDVTAAIILASNIHELENADLHNRICVMHGDLTKNALAAKSWMFKGENDEKIVRLLEEKRPAAIIAVQARFGYLDRLIEDWELDIPSVTVPYTTGLALAQNPTAEARLRIAAARTAGYSSNVVGRTNRNRSSKIVFCAHYDTKFDTPGAYDNGGGVAILLALAEELASKDLAHDLEFVAFTGEEYLPLGDDEYARRCGDGFDTMIAAINFDGVGQRLGSTSIASFSLSAAFQDEASQVIARHPGVTWVDPWVESNHSTFAWRGVPTLAFSTVGGVAIDHLRVDTLDWIDPRRLDDAVAATTELVELLNDKPLSWARETRAEG